MKAFLKCTLIIFLLSSCKTNKNIAGRYFTVKSPTLQSRHIGINFLTNNTFWMNYGAGNDDLSRSYTLSGRWKYIADRTVVIIADNGIAKDTINVAFNDEPFNEERFKKFGRTYYFPNFNQDTIKLSENYKYFFLKGFKFYKTKGNNNYKK